jgi:alpha-L-rhamnosidase
MLKHLFIYLIILLIFLPGLCLSGNPPKNLKVDYNSQPMGVDVPVPGFSWEVGDLSRGAVQSAYRIIVSTSAELIQQEKGDVWDSEKINSNQTIQVHYQGKPLQSMSRYYWAVKTWNGADEASEYSETNWFETGILNPNEWQAQWIKDQREPPEQLEDFYDQIPAPMFRRPFNTGKKVENARLYISGLGYYEAYLNGEKIGDHHLDPGWTQYAKTVYYVVHDVTEMIQQGENVLGVMLGNGWYNPLPMKMFGHNLREVLTIGQPKVMAQLKLEYEDGSTQFINSDQSWKTSTGPIVKNNIYLGEWYDARREQPGWKKAGFDDKKWLKAFLAEPPGGELKWQYIPPIKHTKTLNPVTISEPEEGVYIMDLGQNFAGVIRFKAQAPEGTEIKFRYGELLLEDGSLDIRSTAAAQIKHGQGGPGAPKVAWQEDRYICKGGGTEIFEPKFTFHGFRYVEITGLPYQPSLNDLEGLRLNSDLPDNSAFKCSNPLFNQIQEVTEWTMLSNVHSVESDCPAREKYGYGGDMVAVGEAYIYNYDIANFYKKAVRDFSRDARSNGAMTECAPNIGVNARGVTDESGPVGWTLAHPFLLDKLYKYYGNLELVKEQYQPLKELVDFYHRNVPDHIIMVGIGDHKCVDQRPTPVSSTAFYYHHVKILAKMAGLLNNKQDQEYYMDLAEKIKAAFNEKFVDQDNGQVYTHIQAAQVFALYYDLLPADVRKKALEVLKDEIMIKHNGHLATGIFSTKMMLNLLSDENLDWINYLMINQKDYPGYGYMIANGATTLWENWGIIPDHSMNHPMLGSVSEWFYRSVLGIQQDENSLAFSDIIIKPAIVAGLEFAEGYYHSMRGKIGSKWWKLGDDFIMEVEIPANTTAKIYVPRLHHRAEPEIYESGKSVPIGKEKNLEHINYLNSTNQHHIFSVGAGKYHFKIKH